MPTSKYIAIDLGAESGRVIVGTLAHGRLTLAEAHRFPNTPVALPTPTGTTWHWDALRLWHEIQTGLAKVTPHDSFAGIGVDTWGVDFALLAPDGSLLANPVCYRDDRTTGIPEKVFARIPQNRLYATVGIQSMFFNTLFQLASLSLSGSPLLRQASQLLFMPDLFAYWLSGKTANEYTIASTTMMLDAKARTWWPELLSTLNIPASLFPNLIHPATPHSQLGTLQPSVGNALAATGIPVLAVGGHDTASAVAAIPTTGDDNWLYISSGTWSLMGAEVDQPVLTPQAAQLNLTNEGGVGGKIRLLKNIAGMWFVQQCRHAWAKAGQDFDYATLASLAQSATPHTAILDTDDPAFNTPGDMPEKIAAFCRKTSQPVPTTPGQFIRVILESLAVRYAQVKNMLQDATGKRFTRLHIVGGGCQNLLLNQMAADATGLPVHADPVEATALGNILAQAITTGQIDSLPAARQLLAASTNLQTFTPQNTEKWSTWIH